MHSPFRLLKARLAGSEPAKLSVIVNFYNMPREARRTLHTLTTAYQQGISVSDYEVLVIDNGSSKPLKRDWVEGLSPNFRYLSYTPKYPSPCEALNFAARESSNELLVLCIDGARMFSPGLLALTRLASKIHAHPFIYTLAMHIGSNTQNELIAEGYNQAVEDELLASIDWQSNGYRLFDISTVAKSSGSGFFSQLAETNCFAMRREDYLALGGFNEAFRSRGGGLANHDFFNRANEREDMQVVMLLGEATFHQFHGGVATNVPLEEHPWAEFASEYEAINGKPFSIVQRTPSYFGQVNEHSRPFLKF